MSQLDQLTNMDCQLCADCSHRKKSIHTDRYQWVCMLIVTRIIVYY